MIWRKHGLIYEPNKLLWWQKSHAALPVPVRIRDDLFRVFFSSRNTDQKSHVGWFDINPDQPHNILRTCVEPILSPGPKGQFDTDGIYAASAVQEGSKLTFFTIGWTRAEPYPLFLTAIGRAESIDFGDTISTQSQNPVLERSQYDPSFVSAPFVINEHNHWHMWYISGEPWSYSNGDPASRYNIKYASSVDGKKWHRDGHICIHDTFRGPNVSRLWVIKHRNLYRGWCGISFSGQYKICSFISSDGLKWAEFKSEQGPTPSGSGWDSSAVTYPAVIEHNKKLLMFYNGDSFGRDGIGLATFEL